MQVSLPTQYNGKNQEPVGALSSALARLQVSTGTNCKLCCRLLDCKVPFACKCRGFLVMSHLPALRLQLQANKQLRELREIAKGVTKQLPGVIQNATAKIDEYARGMISGTGSTLFEELGFYYIGPVDGHNLQDLIDVLTGKLVVAPGRTSLRGTCRCALSEAMRTRIVRARMVSCVAIHNLATPHSALRAVEIKATDTVGPVLLHVVTEKGRGYLPAESASDKMHGVVQYDTVTGKQIKAKSQVRCPLYSSNT